MSLNGFIMNFHEDYDTCSYLGLSHHFPSPVLDLAQ